MKNLVNLVSSCFFHYFIIPLQRKKRDIAQLVARHVRDVEAGRSSRPISTTEKKPYPVIRNGFFYSRKVRARIK